MTVFLPPTRFTPDDVQQLEHDGLYELVDGKLVEKPMSSEANEVAWIIGGHFFVFFRQTNAGKAYPEQTYQCFPHDPDLIRRPDLSVVITARLSSVNKVGHVTIAPDIAIEVVSPNDKVFELDEKIADYKSAGVKAIWIVDSKARTVRVIRPGEPTIELEAHQTLTGDPVLPGFSVPVADLFASIPPV
jgi:Uma2 family endonuclease